MVPESVLIRSAGKIGAYIEKYVTRAGAESREEVLKLFESINQLFPDWVIMTCPFMHPDLHFISKNGPHIFGYESEYILEHSTMEKSFYHVHDADQKDLFECYNYTHDFLESVPPSAHSKYRMIFHYRFRKANGQYIHLHDEKAALNLGNAGNLYYVLLRDITSERAFTGVKIEIFKQEQVLTKISEYKPSSLRNRLSKREQELVTLIKQGLSTKEIAGYLSISHNTVRNIKSKLFEKYNVTNSIELLNMTG